jgi:hypothetical protein
VHALPTRSRSSFCRARCALRSATDSGNKVMVRSAAFAFGVVMCGLPSSISSACRTWSCPFARSISPQRTPRASPRRSPIRDRPEDAAHPDPPWSTDRNPFWSHLHRHVRGDGPLQSRAEAAARIRATRSSAPRQTGPGASPQEGMSEHSAISGCASAGPGNAGGIDGGPVR